MTSFPSIESTFALAEFATSFAAFLNLSQALLFGLALSPHLRQDGQRVEDLVDLIIKGKSGM
jgi:hypothetical protein